MDAAALKPFCGEERARSYLHEPFSLGDYTYATDGRVLVRVPRLAGVGEVERAPKAERLFTAYPLATELRPLPAFAFPAPERITCDGCKGLGREHDCPDCQCECDLCDGVGTLETVASASLGGAIFDCRHLKLITALPSVRVPISPIQNEPMRFVFRGGDGLISARTVAADRHIEEPK